METVKKEKHINVFKSGMESVLTVNDGDVVHFECNDCFLQQVKTEEDVITKLDPQTLNPATGPIFVKGAEKGDILKVDVLDIQLAPSGCVAIVESDGFLKEECKKSLVKIVPVEEGRVIFGDLSIPIRPMIGVIGVAPSKEEGEWMTNTPWKHGGNMDTTEITKGTSLYFPVSEAGANLALGDCHAIMGDGEICITGLEIPADVYLRVSVIKNKSIIWPLLETESSTLVIGSGKSLEDATRNSMKEAVNILNRSLDIAWEEAYMLGSLVVDAKISQVVNPMVTVRAEIPKSIVSTEKILATY